MSANLYLVIMCSQVALIKTYTSKRVIHLDEGGDLRQKPRKKGPPDADGAGPSNSLVSGDGNESETSFLGSENELSDNEEELIDDLVEVTNNLDDTCTTTPNKTNDKGDDVDKLFADNYIDPQPVVELAPVSELLAHNLTTWCRQNPKREQVKSMFKECLCPSNVEGLKPVKINELLYKALPSRAKISDQKLKGLNTFISRAMGPVVQVFEQLCTLEAELKSQSVSNSSKEDQSMSVGKINLPVSQMRKQIGCSLKLSCAAHAIILQRRKSSIKPLLDPKFQHLARDSNTVTNWLFGDNLEQSITDSAKGIEVARKLYHRQRDFRPRRFAQNRRFSQNSRFKPYSSFQGKNYEYRQSSGASGDDGYYRRTDFQRGKGRGQNRFQRRPRFSNTRGRGSNRSRR